ncbi:MAG: SDR family NAD(P)-dependent oxidoreductase [Acidimicrobiales bacterium]
MTNVAVITGGSQGLGQALAERLATDGWSIVIDARRADRLGAAVDQLQSSAAEDSTIVGVAGDVTDPVHRRALADAARELGPVGLLVNNASTLGASPLPRLVAIDADVLRRTFDVNVVAPVALIGELADDLADGATVANISSDAALGAYEGWGGYGSSKAALDQVSRVLAAEHPEWRVLAIDPGDMATEMHQAAFPGEDISDRPDPTEAVAAVFALISGEQPSGRYPSEEQAP